MRTLWPVALVFVFGVSTAARADKKLDEAIAKANEQLQKGKPDEAVRTLSKAASQLASSPEAQVALGRMQERVGKLDEAGTSYTKAVNVGATASASARAEARTALAAFELRTGSARTALPHAREAVRLQPGVEPLATLSRAQARLQDPLALATAERAIAAEPGHPVGHLARGDALFAVGRFGDAVSAYRKAVELAPKSAPALTGLAVALTALGQPTEAETAARQAVKIDDLFGEAYAALGLALISQGKGAWSDAIGSAQQGAFFNPKSAIIQAAIGRIFAANDAWDQAIAAFRRAIELDPDLSTARDGLVDALFSSGNAKGAVDEARRHVAEQPGSGGARLVLGRLLLRTEDFQGAVAALQEAVKLVPALAEAHARLGTAYFGSGALPKAVVAYGKAAQLDPDNLEYRTTYSLFLAQSGDYERGIAEMIKVTSRPGYRDRDGFINLGWLYRSVRPPRVGESVAAYRKALEIDPRSAEAALGITSAYYWNKQWDQAIEAFTGAATVDQRLAGDAAIGIARCHFFKRETDRARTYANQAKEAGHPDADHILAAIDKYETAFRRGPEAARQALVVEQQHQRDTAALHALVDQLRSSSPARQQPAARGLIKTGREAVPYLGYALLTVPGIDVRSTIVRGLSGMRCHASAALPLLERVLRQPSEPIPLDGETTLIQGMREEDLRREIENLVVRLRGC